MKTGRVGWFCLCSNCDAIQDRRGIKGWYCRWHQGFTPLNVEYHCEDCGHTQQFGKDIGRWYPVSSY